MTYIESSEPKAWRDLELHTAQILRECGLETRVGVSLDTARGSVDVDVLSVDGEGTPPVTLIVECKNWHRKISKHVVHAFRAVVGDSGADIGIIISSSGFQQGARQSANWSNIKLATWREFEEMFEERWIRQYMTPHLQSDVGPLLEYTEPINSRIFAKADQLSASQKQKFKDLRSKHTATPFLALRLAPGLYGFGQDWVCRPALPLRSAFSSTNQDLALWSGALDATALREVLIEVTKLLRAATAEFDDLFGGRV